MHTIEEKYQWLLANFQTHSLKMDGTKGFRFMSHVLGRFMGRSVDEVIEKAMDEHDAYIAELKAKSELNPIEQYILDCNKEK